MHPDARCRGSWPPARCTPPDPSNPHSREMHTQCEGQNVLASKLSSPGDTVNLHWSESMPRAWLDLLTERQPTFITGGLPASAPVGPSQSPWSPPLCKTQSRTTGSTPALRQFRVGPTQSQALRSPRAQLTSKSGARHQQARQRPCADHTRSPQVPMPAPRYLGQSPGSSVRSQWRGTVLAAVF